MTALLIDFAIAFGGFWLGWFGCALASIVGEEERNYNQTSLHTKIESE